MDLTSLSLFMQTSMAYECMVCKLYFGTEDQLLGHHKRSHSKRLKVSINPELKLTEDEDYNISHDEPSVLSSSSGNNNTQDDHGVAKLESNDGNIPISAETIADDGATDFNETSVDMKVFRQSSDGIEDSYQISSRHSVAHDNDDGSTCEIPEKLTKTETRNNRANKSPAFTSGGQIIKESTATIIGHHQYSDSMKTTIEQGQYGYLTDSGFQRFSLEELKKFAVQVVALFKLDESQQEGDSNAASSQSMPSPVNRTPSAFQFHHEHGGSNSIAASDMISRNHYRGQATAPVQSAESSSSSSGNVLDDANKSCYKCGEHGHFAWGCTNPRNPEIQPKRKRVRNRGKKKGQLATSTAGNSY